MIEPFFFVPTHHQIEVLDRLTAGAFDQIVDYRNHDNPAFDPIRIDRNPAIIGAAHMPRVGGRRAAREPRAGVPTSTLTMNIVVTRTGRALLSSTAPVAARPK